VSETAKQIAGRKRYPKIDAFGELRPSHRLVAMLLVEGVPRATIARQLGMTCAAVSTATHRLLCDLEVAGVAGLTRLAIRRGYIRP
jgi:DNA-binding NarL/FixJ family response regulator